VKHVEDEHERYELRKTFANYIHKAYNTYCPQDTARQLDAWAQARPNLGKYLAKENKPVVVQEIAVQRDLI
jgi:CRISPR system Cascade subunit CasA